MFQSMLHLIKASPNDVQVWDCDPLVIDIDGAGMAYAHRTKVEFTPLDSPDIIGHATTLTPDPNGQQHEIAIVTKQIIECRAYLPSVSLIRPGLILTGFTPNQEPVTWLVNGPADEYLRNPWPAATTSTDLLADSQI